jgi:preprotein translocase subunit SecG
MKKVVFTMLALSLMMTGASLIFSGEPATSAAVVGGAAGEVAIVGAAENGISVATFVAGNLVVAVAAAVGVVSSRDSTPETASGL